MRSARHHDQGSVLVDALVTIGVLMIASTFAAQAAGDSALRMRSSEGHRIAQLEARSRMAEVGADIPIIAGQANGEDGDLIWSVDIAPASEDATAGASALMDVKVSVGTREKPTLVVLHSLRIGTK